MIRSAHRLVGAATLSLVAGAGCALFVLACVGDDPLTPLADASTDVASPESSADTSMAAPDASPDAAPLGFCKSGGPHDLCVDFDDDVDLLQVFPVLEKEGTGVRPIVVHDAGTPLPLGAMRSDLERGPSDAGYHAARFSAQDLYPASLGATRPRVKISFDLLVARADISGSGAYVMNLEGPVFRLYLNTVDGGSDLMVSTVRNDGTGSSITEDPGFRIKVGAWTRFVLSVGQRTGDPSGAGATLSVGGMSSTYTLVSEALPSGLRADIGLGTTNATGVAWTVYYDNVALDWK
jgi:hypothetical protein